MASKGTRKGTITTDQLAFFLRELARELRLHQQAGTQRPSNSALAYAHDADEIARDLETGACTVIVRDCGECRDVAREVGDG